MIRLFSSQHGEVHKLAQKEYGMPDNRPLVSYIILSYLRSDYIPGCLKSIRDETYRPLEVVLVDNGGDLEDSILDNVQDAGIDAYILRPGKNLGVAGGRNYGIQHSSGEIMIFIDDDALLNQVDTTARIVDSLINHPDWATLSFRSVDPQGVIRPAEVPYAGRKDPTSTAIIEVPYFLGGVVAFRRSNIEPVGYYPAEYIYCMEEYDLALRLLNAGFKMYYDPNLLMTHFKADQGHNMRKKAGGAAFCSMNKTLSAFRLLPYPYPFIVAFSRFFRLLWLSRFNLKMAYEFLHTLRKKLPQVIRERQPVSRQTVRYIFSIGGWVMFV